MADPKPGDPGYAQFILDKAKAQVSGTVDLNASGAYGPGTPSANQVWANEIKTQAGRDGTAPSTQKPSTTYTQYPTTLERNLAQQQQSGWPQFATKDQLVQQGFIPFGNENKYVSRDGRTYSLTNTGMFQVGYNISSNADRQNLANLIARGAFNGTPAAAQAVQTPANGPVSGGTGAQQGGSTLPSGTSSSFYQALKDTGTVPDPSSIGRVGAVFNRDTGQPRFAPEGYRTYTPNLRVDNDIRSRGGQPRVPDSLYNSTTLMVPDAYRPGNAFAPGEGLITGGLASNYDFNGASAGGDSYMAPTGYQTAELRGGTAGGWGINSNSILSDFGYQPSGDPVADAAKAFEIRQNMESSGLTGQAALDAYGPQQVDPTTLDPGQSTYFQTGAGPDETVQRTDSGYIFYGAADGASMKMRDPFAIVNLRTGNRIIGSEYGQPEMLHVNNNRIAVQPMGKPMSKLPDATTMMAADGAQIDTQQYYDDGTPINGGVARQSQVNWANAIAPTASQPTGMSVADRERENAIAYSDSQGYQPTRTISWSQTNEQQPPSVGRMGGSTFAEANRMQTLDNARRGLDANGWPLGTWDTPATPNPGTPAPGTGSGGNGGGSPTPGGSGGNGGWPNTTVPNPTPAPIPNLPTTGTYPGTVPGTVQPTDPVAAATEWARRQRGRDIEGQYYGQFGLPRPREVTVPTLPAGVNPGAGLYYNTPDYGSQALGLEENLAMLGNTGNTQDLLSQIESLRSQLGSDQTANAGIYTQIDNLNQQLSRARQADEIRRQLGVLGVNGPSRGPSDVIGPMPGERPEDSMPMPSELAAPVSASTPDIPTAEFQRIHRKSPMVTAKLLQLDNMVNQYGDTNPEYIRQVSEMIAQDPDPEAVQVGSNLLARIVSRMNAGRPSPAPLGVSPMPEDPIAALAYGKFAA